MVIEAQGACYVIASASGSLQAVLTASGDARAIAQAIGYVYQAPAAGWFKAATTPATPAAPAGPAFHRAVRATPGGAITSRHLKALRGPLTTVRGAVSGTPHGGPCSTRSACFGRCETQMQAVLWPAMTILRRTRCSSRARATGR